MVIYIVFFLRQTPQRCWKLIVVVNGMVDLTLRTGRTSVPFIYFTFSQRTFHFERSERSWKPKNSEPRCKCDKMVNGTREFQRLPFQKFSFSPKISSSLKWKIVSIFILTEISGNFSKWKTNYTSGVSSLGRTSATDMGYLVSNYHIRFSRLENFRLINLSTQDSSNIWLFTITLPDVVFVFIKDVFFFCYFFVLTMSTSSTGMRKKLICRFKLCRKKVLFLLERQAAWPRNKGMSSPGLLEV